MAIALIGAILKRNASEEKWKSVADKLKKSHYHLHAAVRLIDWNYQHPTLNASIELRLVHGRLFITCDFCTHGHLPWIENAYFHMVVFSFIPAN